MIDLERSKLLKIKRASTEWWINEKSMVGRNGKTYIGYVTDTGEVHVKELDAKCSRTPSRDVCLCRLNCDYADEHNAPSVLVLESGKIIVAYTGHAVQSTLYYHITERPYDIMSFGPRRTLNVEGEITYAQLFENTRRKELWLFSRVSCVNWVFRYSRDEGETWSEPKTILHSDDGGLFYLDVRRVLITDHFNPSEGWFFALYGHPRISKDHKIRSGIFDYDGYLRKSDGTRTDYCLFHKKSGVIDLDSLDVVYESPEGTTVRLLDVAPTPPFRVGFAPFVIDKDEAPDPTKPTYYSATFCDGKWQVSAPICTAGEFLAKDILDGSQTYLGGMAYYYGVGEAGLRVFDAITDSNRIFIARFDGKNRVLESYVSYDKGKTYELEQVIRSIPAEKNIKIWRPTVPIYAQDNLQVYWHEGVYRAHTGGWTSDAVMYVEYDD